MTGVMVLRAADRRPQPWKNGGGVTREVMVYPPDTGMDDFQWRASIANVGRAGPFSRFRGIDRVLTVLAGDLDLAIEDGASVLLSSNSAPFPFDGDAAAFGRPLGGLVTDFNIMTRRGLWAADVRRFETDRAGAIKHGLSGAGIILATGRMHVAIDGAATVLERLDAAFTLKLEDVELSTDRASGAVLASLNGPGAQTLIASG